MGLSVVGIDAGRPPKTVWACNTSANVFSRKPPENYFDIAIAEKPNARANSKVNPESLIKVAGYGMAALFSVRAARRYWVPVETWKRYYFGAAWNMKKAAACANFAEMFDLSFLDPNAGSDQDCLDAYAIMMFAANAKTIELEPYEVSW